MTDLDIIIPVFNSSNSISNLIGRLNEWHKVSEYRFKVIFVDDASSDNSVAQIIKTNKDFEFKLIELGLNYGQHTATAVGIGAAKSKVIATIDDDLQHDPFELEKLIKTLHLENADLVYGIYQKKEHSITRNLGTLLLKKILHLLKLDYNSVTSFRVFKSSLGNHFKEINTTVFFIDGYLNKYAVKQASCVVNHHKRADGTSNYTYWKLIKFSLQILLFHSSAPLKFIARFGLFMAILFFISGCYFIYNKMFYNVPLGYTSLIVALFFSTGMIMMSLGVIGEYVRKIWISQAKLDQIIIKEYDAK